MSVAQPLPAPISSPDTAVTSISGNLRHRLLGAQRRIVRMSRLLALAAVTTAALVLLAVPPVDAQLATITFPDTPVGATSTVKCPTTTVSICFGSNCAGSNSVQSVSGPGAPFSVGKFNLLSNSEFFAGQCEAHPVTLPVAVGPGQILAYQATFAPTSAGTSNGSLTFNTASGPATVNLTGTAGAGPSGGAGQGVISLEASPEVVVPGHVLDVGYQSAPGTVGGKVDTYVALVLGSDQYLFFTPAGTSSTPVPLAANGAAIDGRTSLFSGPLVDAAFGTYTLGIAWVHAATASLASNISLASFTVAALSTEQTAVLQARGNPEFLVVNWSSEQARKTESWFYYSGTPTVYRFENGALTSQSALSGPVPAPVAKVDPSLFTPLTTLETLKPLGPPASVVPTDPEILPGYETVTYPFGLEVTLRDGRFVSARSVTQ